MSARSRSWSGRSRILHRTLGPLIDGTLRRFVGGSTASWLVWTGPNLQVFTDLNALPLFRELVLQNAFLA